VTQSLAIAQATDCSDSGTFLAHPTRQVAFRMESQRAGPCPGLPTYLAQETVPAAHRLGATARVLGNPAARWPFLIAHRDEAGDLPTVLTYGHVDVILAEEHHWRSDRDGEILSE
jgi:hypothetical protein